MKDLQINYGHKNNQSHKRQKPDDSDSENDNDNNYDNKTWSRFLVIESADERELAKLSPFAVSKGINGLTGEPKSLKDCALVHIWWRSPARHMQTTS